MTQEDTPQDDISRYGPMRRDMTQYGPNKRDAEATQQ